MRRRLDVHDTSEMLKIGLCHLCSVLNGVEYTQYAQESRDSIQFSLFHTARYHKFRICNLEFDDLYTHDIPVTSDQENLPEK